MELPPIVAVIGRKNSGKTTLVVGIAAELRRRGMRVATVKHSHHDFEIDHPGKDSWRHFHEGGADAVLIASPHRVALIARQPDADRDPRLLIERFYAGQGYDLILVEAFKHIPFPRIEIFRAAVHAEPVYQQSGDQEGSAVAEPSWLAIVTDAPDQVRAPFPVIPISHGDDHLTATADVIEAWIASGADAAE